jgi:hypothetical protein
MILKLLLMMIGCDDHYCDLSPLSDCSYEVLITTEDTYEYCFEGDDVYGPCETCGYTDDRYDAQNYYDCITCAPGFELEVVFRDCTGICVPEGKAIFTLEKAACYSPVECIQDQQSDTGLLTPHF